MQIVPLTPVASQQLNVSLSNQAVTLSIYQRSTGLYMDVALNGTTILAGQICLNNVWMVRSAYLGMPGDLFFYDTQGTDDPTYDGLGARYLLIYVPGQNVAVAA